MWSYYLTTSTKERIANTASLINLLSAPKFNYVKNYILYLSNIPVDVVTFDGYIRSRYRLSKTKLVKQSDKVSFLQVMAPARFILLDFAILTLFFTNTLRREGFIHMLRRFLLVSGLILASTIGFASSAKAASEPLEFTGEVPTACTLTNPVAGTLGVNSANTTLSSSIDGGTAARINIDCTGGNLSITAPTKISGSGGTANNDFETLTATIKTVNDTSVSSGAPAVPIAAADKGTATVNMQASDTTAIRSGTYTFQVVVTATKGQ